MGSGTASLGPDVADTWAEVLRTATGHARDGLDEPERGATLTRVMSLACLSVPGTLTCSITLQSPGGRFITEATEGALASELDDVQYLADDGPCLSAARHQRRERIDTMTHDDRWPSLSGSALKRGVNSSLSIPLPVQQRQSLRALNFYGEAEHGFTAPRTAALAGFVARVAAALLPDADPTGTDPLGADRSAQAWRALTEGREVRRAQTAMMAEHRTDATTAYRRLALASARQARPLVEIARDVLAGPGRE